LFEPYLSSNPFFFMHQFNFCLTSNAFYHIQHIITNAICQWLASHQHNKTMPPMANQYAGNVSTLLPPCRQPLAPTSRSLLAARRPTFVLASTHCHLTPGKSPAAISAPLTAQTK
jgi:hypothetical protein